MIGNARIIITDGTQENTASILATIKGAQLDDWYPKSPQPATQIWTSTPYQDGKQLVSKTFDNIIDAFIVKIDGASQDTTIKNLRKFLILLEQAVWYWTDEYNTHKYWLEVRGTCETEIRYAKVVDYSIPEITNPIDLETVMDEVNIIIEHTIWTNTLTQGEECLITSTGSTQPLYEVIPTEDKPLADLDDCYVNLGASTLIDDANLMMGKILAVQYSTGVRFQTVAVPQGALIYWAWIQFRANANQAGTTCNLRIYGEDTNDALIFSTFANFQARKRTVAYVNWSAVPAWTSGSDYITPDISPIIQEIVNKPTWVSGNDLVIFVQDNSSSSGAYRQAASFNDVRPEPILYILYADPSTGVIHGSTSDCIDFLPAVQNLWRDRHLTHAFYYDSTLAGYSGNMVDDDPGSEANLFPNPLVAGDIFYAGIADIGGLPAGKAQPFYSLVVNLTAIAVGITTAVYEYWDGAAWSPMNIQYQPDNLVTIAVLETGQHFITWQPEPDWTENTVNGIDGYWMRIRITAAAVGATPPVRDPTKAIYTISWNHVQVSGSNLLGDTEAIIDMLLGMLVASCDHVLVAAREYSRTNNGIFTNILPANQTNVDERNAYYYGKGATTTDVATPLAPTGRVTRWAPGGSAAETVGTWRLDGNTYPGRYRAFVRCYPVGITGTEIVTLYLRISTSFGYSYSLPGVVIYPSVLGDYLVVDLGLISIPPEMLEVDYLPTYGTLISLEASTTAALTRIDFIDLILMPVDDAFVEFKITNNDPGSLYQFRHPLMLVTSTEQTGAYSFNMTNDFSGHSDMEVDWNLLASEQIKNSILGNFELKPNKDYWIFILPYEDIYPGADIWQTLVSPAFAKKQRYFLARGDE